MTYDILVIIWTYFRLPRTGIDGRCDGQHCEGEDKVHCEAEWEEGWHFIPQISPAGK